MKRVLVILACCCSILLSGGCAVRQGTAPAGFGPSKTLEPGKSYEVCVDAAPAQELLFSFAATAPVSYDVHYHNKMHGVSFLVRDQGDSVSKGRVTAPIRTSYCLLLKNTGDWPVAVQGELKTIGAAMPPDTTREQRPHDHDGGHHGMAMAGPGKMKDTGSEQTQAPDYIRVKSPAGYDVVIGRKNPLPELAPEIVVDKQGKTVKVFHMTVKDVKFEIFPGKFIQGWGFNGHIPGPTIRVNEGDRIRIFFTNQTDTEHTLHIHGQTKPLNMDGVPYLSQKPVKKGETFVYEFVVRNPGTHWYHCHVDSAHHVDMGMYGAFLVEPKHKKLVYDREYTMLLDEWPTAHIHMHQVPEAGTGDGGHQTHEMVSQHPGAPMAHHLPPPLPKRDWYPETYKEYKPVYDGFTINGRSFPFTEPLEVKKGERVLIRFINAGYKSHFMHTHSHKFIVVARSGSPVNEPQKIDTVEIGPGQRVDILLKADNPGVWPFHCHRIDHIANDHVYPGGMLTFIRYVDAPQD